MTQQPKQRQRQEESAEGGRRVVGGEHQEEEKPEGRAAPPAGPEGTARLGARPVGEDEGILVVPFSGGRLAPTAAGNNPLGSQPAGQGWAPPHATSVSCPAPVATPSSASAHGTALPPFTLPVAPPFCARAAPPGRCTWSDSHTSCRENPCMTELLGFGKDVAASTEAVTCPRAANGQRAAENHSSNRWAGKGREYGAHWHSHQTRTFLSLAGPGVGSYGYNFPC